MRLKDQIKKLINLQELDKEIYQLNSQKNNDIPAKIGDIKNIINQKQESFASYKKTISQLELEKKKKEGELNQKEETLKKTRAQLYQLKSNKEYQAKLKEISSLEADVSCVEDEVITFLDSLEQEKGKVEKKKQLLDSEVKDLKQKVKELEDSLKEIEEKVKDQEAKRKDFCDGIDKKILNKYQDFLEKRGGLAIVPVKNNNCSACYIAVTHQKLNEIKMFDKLVSCENCVRILYIPEDLEL